MSTRGRAVERAGAHVAAVLLVLFNLPGVALADDAAGPEDPADRISVVVLDVRSSGPVGPRQVEGLSAVLTSEFGAYRRLQVISNADVRDILGFEAQRLLLGCDANECLAEIGGALGANYLVSSEVSRFGNSWLFSLVIIDLRDASPVRRLSVRKRTEDEILDELAIMVRIVASGILPEEGKERYEAAHSDRTPARDDDDDDDDGDGDESSQEREASGSRSRSEWFAERAYELVPGANGYFGPEFALRAGMSGHAGVLGVAVEARAAPLVGIALGTGTHLLGGGVSIGGQAWRGAYVDGQIVWLRANPLTGYSGGNGVGVGATAGWELRPLRWLSIKAGAGYGWNTAKGRGGLLIDLMVGPVF